MPVCDLCGSEFPHTAWYGTGRTCLACQTPPVKHLPDELYSRAVREADADLKKIFPGRKRI